MGDRGSVKYLLLICVLIFVAAFICAGQSNPTHRLADFNVVQIDLRPSIEIRPVIARQGGSIGEAFSSVIERYKPYAAINGTYYDFDMRPLGDILANGKLINRGGYRNGVAWTKTGKVVFLHKDRGRLNWSGCRSGVAAGPRLIHNGRIALDPVADGFSRRSLTKTALRSGIGKTSRGKLLLVTSKRQITLGEFSQAMLDLGAVEAMNLDGGGASGLYCNGKTFSSPTLPMSNVILVFKR